MNKCVLTLLAVIVLAACAPGQRFEASTNLDLSDIRPFLHELDKELDLGIDPAKLAAFTDAVPIGEQASRQLNITYGGRRRSVEYVVVMDDFTSPDVYFFTTHEDLAVRIQEFIVAFAVRRGR